MLALWLQIDVHPVLCAEATLTARTPGAGRG